MQTSTSCLREGLHLRVGEPVFRLYAIEEQRGLAVQREDLTGDRQGGRAASESRGPTSNTRERGSKLRGPRAASACPVLWLVRGATMIVMIQPRAASIVCYG